MSLVTVQLCNQYHANVTHTPYQTKSGACISLNCSFSASYYSTTLPLLFHILTSDSLSNAILRLSSSLSQHALHLDPTTFFTSISLPAFSSSSSSSILTTKLTNKHVHHLQSFNPFNSCCIHLHSQTPFIFHHIAQLIHFLPQFPFISHSLHHGRIHTPITSTPTASTQTPRSWRPQLSTQTNDTETPRLPRPPLQTAARAAAKGRPPTLLPAETKAPPALLPRMLLHLLHHLPHHLPYPRHRRRRLLPLVRARPAGVPPQLLPRPHAQRLQQQRRCLPRRRHDGAGGGAEPEWQDVVALREEQGVGVGG
ncbi:hypothetical protein V8G54_032999 [Vigna mungo]|uniref:Uncharacterized protein n=1 Tax=Vigna mungo TaxID=3915 RepID=A0AAQ3RH75_VIGMU